MVHVTCLAHALHRVAESVRSKYTVVDKFVSSMKKILLKAPDRVTSFHEQCPNIALPPKPILTRWGTWLTAVSYYPEHWNEISSFVETLDPESSSAIKTVQKLSDKKKIENKNNYGHRGNSRTLLRNCSYDRKTWNNVHAAIRCNWPRDDAVSYLSAGPHAVIATKVESVAQKNPGLSKMSKLARRDESILNKSPFNEMTPAELANFKFAPVVSCEVERSFSQFKAVLRDNRRSFLIENLKEHLVIASFSR